MPLRNQLAIFMSPILPMKKRLMQRIWRFSVRCFGTLEVYYYTGMILENKNKGKLMWKYLIELMPRNSKSNAKSLLVADKIVTDPKTVTKGYHWSSSSIHPYCPTKYPSISLSHCHFRIC